MISELHQLSAPQIMLIGIPAEGVDPALANRYPVLQGKQAAADGSALAYVCQQGSCQAPTGEVNELLRQVTAGWTH
jgi:uncharacterized protein YyaL (SSP411 family)